MSAKNYENPEEASRPFDKDRSGFVLGEGSGVLIIESEEHAKKRGAKIHGEILGYGYCSDGFHLVRPESSGEGQIDAMTKAIEMSGIDYDKIDCVNTHATSTPAGDKIEANSIKKLFGTHQPYVTAHKGAIGHTFGAAGSIELILGINSMKEVIKIGYRVKFRK